MDLTDPGRATHLVETFVLPGISALHAAEVHADHRHHPVRVPTDTHDIPTTPIRET